MLGSSWRSEWVAVIGMGDKDQCCNPSTLIRITKSIGSHTYVDKLGNDMGRGTNSPLQHVEQRQWYEHFLCVQGVATEHIDRQCDQHHLQRRRSIMSLSCEITENIFIPDDKHKTETGKPMATSCPNGAYLLLPIIFLGRSNRPSNKLQWFG